MLGGCVRRSLILNRRWITQSLRYYSQNHYEVLGVPRKASSKDIQEAFLEKSKQLHPDKKMHDGEQHDKFVRLNEAYTCLNRPESRSEYDATLPPEVHRVHVNSGNPANLRAGKKGLFRVPKERYYGMALSSCAAAMVAVVIYLITLDLYKGREQELFLLFKSPEEPDEGEEE